MGHSSHVMVATAGVTLVSITHGATGGLSNSSGYKGTMKAPNGRFRARVSMDSKAFYAPGMFLSAEAAARAYDA